jgi:cell division protein FtsB
LGCDGEIKGRVRVSRKPLIGSGLLVVLAGLVVLCWFWYNSDQRRDERAWRRVRAALGREYAELKADSVKLGGYRKKCLDQAAWVCEHYRKRYDFSKSCDGESVARALDGALASLQSGEIEDGVPRVVLAFRWDMRNPCLRVEWIESDFDTVSLCITNETESVTIQHDVFENHNLEKDYMFQYDRGCSFDTSPSSELAATRAQDKYVILKYVGKGVPRFWGPYLSAPLVDTETTHVYLPDGDLFVYLRDRAGNESNRLPLVRGSDMMRRKEHSLEEELEALTGGKLKLP